MFMSKFFKKNKRIIKDEGTRRRWCPLYLLIVAIVAVVLIAVNNVYPKTSVKQLCQAENTSSTK